MSEPPYGAPEPTYGGAGAPQRPGSAYPQQELLPQHVQPSRSRLPWLVGAVLAAAVLTGGLLTWWLLRDSGEENRAAYCSAVRTLTHNGNLQQAASGGLADAPAAVARVRDLAPGAVRVEWDDLLALVRSPPTGSPDLATGLRVLSDVRAIVDDANAKCGLRIPLTF